jgi:hypothetical protein
MVGNDDSVALRTAISPGTLGGHGPAQSRSMARRNDFIGDMEAGVSWRR